MKGSHIAIAAGIVLVLFATLDPNIGSLITARLGANLNNLSNAVVEPVMRIAFGILILAGAIWAFKKAK